MTKYMDMSILNFRSTSSAVAFYRERFPSIMEGTNYVVNAFPFLYFQTLAELRSQYGDMLQVVLKRVKFQGPNPVPTGEHLAALKPRETVERESGEKEIVSLGLFPRVVLEMWRIRAIGRKAGRLIVEEGKQGNFQTDITDLARQFYDEYFARGTYGPVFVHELFPAWFEDVSKTTCTRQSHVAKVRRLMQGVVLDQPELAGCRAAPLVQAGDPALAAEMSRHGIFVRACQEIYVAGQHAKPVRRSEDTARLTLDVTKATARYFHDSFPSALGGYELLIEAYPDLVRRTVEQEIRGRFSKKELAEIEEAMRRVRKEPKKGVKAPRPGKPTSSMAGELLIPVCQVAMHLRRGAESDLIDRLSGLTPFARMCLELGLVD